MTLLDRIAECNLETLSGFEPLFADGRQIGWVAGTLTESLLTGETGVLRLEHGLTLKGNDYDALTQSALAVQRALLSANFELRLRDERCHVFAEWPGRPLLEADRALLPVLGIRGYGVHLNCFVRRGASLFLWVAVRSASCLQYPNLLDTSVGGCLPAGARASSWMAKEAADEAGIGADRMANARAAGVTSYARVDGVRFRRSVQLNFDLEVDEAFVPRPLDGEVESFHLIRAEEVLERLSATRDFKPNSGLVIIDFLVRHGVITHDWPDYVEIVRGLRGGLSA